MNVTFDFGGATQYGSTFSVSNITQDGYTTGRLIGMDIDKSGVVQARFTNGRSIMLGQVALSNFANSNGLQQLACPLDATTQQHLLEYIALLLQWNAAYNLTAVRDANEMLTHHLLDSLAVIAPLRRELAKLPMQVVSTNTEMSSLLIR